METVLTSIKNAIETANIASVVFAYPGERKFRYDSPVIALKISRCKADEGAMLSYLGREYDAQTDKYIEKYGRKTEMTVTMDVFCPVYHGYSGLTCENVFTATVSCLSCLGSGIKIREFNSADTSYDKALDMYKCVCELKISAFLILESDGESEEFSDFSLRGEIRN